VIVYWKITLLLVIYTLVRDDIWTVGSPTAVRKVSPLDQHKLE